ncbi:ATP-binding protein [Rickettsiales endosymbiont of Peranema trichophorum]|uniref:YifB family Mg chelatase-like AAA ATPase n=1 Tax=Rickettsiales endosymbiont of Peranema trichophorum TaxID=2486577 RepID=UPI0010235689|nr:YifB family Mg chelatase-like AAA ATPase [Rickettsiales endosymbiont of Peranema trichophorum]RZI47806.1 ATP-binding protein [Rickettsiales endosymbiont of Peranema trichophorum]
MISNVKTVCFLGVECKEVDVQVHIASGLPRFNIVGLPDKSVAESKERVRAVFHSIGVQFPMKRITINLSPADILKEGSHFDLPIAVGMLIALGTIKKEFVERYLIMGELSLDGRLKGVSGVLPAAIFARHSNLGLVCPESNREEAAWSSNANVLAISSLMALLDHYGGKNRLPHLCPKVYNTTRLKYPDLKDVKGQKVAKRALEISAAGGHSLLMVGPPGSGKSMLAKRLPGILPELTLDDVLEISTIASIAGLLNDEKGVVLERPCRSPHSSASVAAMVGGGRNALPGEVTLAHKGVLFLDELPEFSRGVLESLRQPIEAGNISIARVNSHVTYPSNFQLIAAMNPCRCGYFGTSNQNCAKAPRCAQDYQNKISGPILDRFDLRVDVPSTNIFDMGDEQSESSAEVAQRVSRAREIQRERYKGTNISVNALVDVQLLNEVVIMDSESASLLKTAVDKFQLSMRGFYRVLKVARTIADLEEKEDVRKSHFVEALYYRMCGTLQ